MNKNIIKILLFITIIPISLLGSCRFSSTFENFEKDKRAAELVTDKFYALLKDKNYINTYVFFSADFFSNTDTGKLNDIYATTYNKLGAIESFNIEKWKTEDVYGSNSRTNYSFLYKVKRKKYDSEESIVLAKENGIVKIIGYHVYSESFSQTEKN